MPSIGNNKNVLVNNIPSTSSNSGFTNPYKNSKRRKLESGVDKSPSSKEQTNAHRREKTLRNLSDYESGDSDVQNAGSSSSSISRFKTRGTSKKTTKNVPSTNIQFEDSSSTDSDEFVTRLSSSISRVKTGGASKKTSNDVPSTNIKFEDSSSIDSDELFTRLSSSISRVKTRRTSKKTTKNVPSTNIQFKDSSSTDSDEFVTRLSSSISRVKTRGASKKTSNDVPSTNIQFEDSSSTDSDEFVTRLSSSISRVKTGGASKKTSKDVPSTNIQFEDLSSSDSDECFIRHANKRGSMRALSDYETGDSIDQAAESLLVSSDVNQISTNFTPHNNVSSSDNDSVYKITRSKFKRPHNLFSTSDSSDSDTPIKQQCKRKRKRINTSSEESEDQNVNNTQSFNRNRTNQNDLPSTNPDIRSYNTRLQTTRQLRPRSNDPRTIRETESNDSDDSNRLTTSDFREIYRRRLQTTRQLRPRNNNPRTIRETESSESDDLDDSNRLRTSDFRELYRRRTGSIQQNNILTTTRRQVTRRISPMRSRNNEIERESEPSSDESTTFMRTVEYRGSTFRIRYYNNFPSDNDSNLQFEQRRLQRGTAQIHFSDSNSNSEQIQINVDNSGPGTSVLIPSTVHDTNSSDSDEESDKCPICFSCFGSKEVASPESCDHSFCTKCIQEWAKIINTCPIDRKRFIELLVRPNINGKVIRKIPIEHTETQPWVFEIIPRVEVNLQEVDDEDDDECCVCHSTNNSQDLISCDYCHNIYHLSCLTPPLRYVPAREWYCPPCLNHGPFPDIF